MLISIVLVTYNLRSYIEECLDSIMVNLDEDIELIVVDDGSCDGTLEILRTFSGKNVRVYSNEHLGLGNARNFGISKVRGDYTIFVDGDDLLGTKIIQRLRRTVHLYTGVDVIQFGWESIDDDGQVLSVNQPRGIDYSTIACWNKCYRTKVIKSIKFTENLLFEDLEFFVQSFTRMKNYVEISDVLYRHRQRPSGITRRRLKTEERLQFVESLQIALSNVNNTNNIQYALGRTIYRQICRIYQDCSIRDEGIIEGLNKASEVVRDNHLFVWNGTLSSTYKGSLRSNIIFTCFYLKLHYLAKFVDSITNKNKTY
ncbi:glycosyltransferase family A protein [Weissella cibaria]|uniref:glycosyltransferase family 2 protein n=1 Tax=Weissella cibaria TaxID=137591 RepID=UPI0015F84DF8|nr:glycosyltransferase family A protein [Weissella cibaria]MCQ9619142.1 glycosyltransferase family 2 protein [Weissella cibaria]